MNSAQRVNTIRKRHGLLVRGVAVFFVLFAVADIIFPEYCREASAKTSVESREFMTVAYSSGMDDSTRPITAAFVSGHNRQDQPDRNTPHEGDCFGCCAHVLPGVSFTKVSIPEIKLPSPILETPALPTSPLQSLFHPPRLA